MSRIVTKNRKPCHVTIDKHLWKLVDHFLPAGHSKSSYIEQCYLDLIKKNLKGFARMIDEYKDTEPNKCFLYDEWIMRVGLVDEYEEARKEYLSEKHKKGLSQPGNTQNAGEGIHKSSSSNVLPPPHAVSEVKPPYGKFHSMLKVFKEDEEVKDEARIVLGQHVNDEFVDKSQGELFPTRNKNIFVNHQGEEFYMPDEADDDAEDEPRRSMKDEGEWF